LDQNTQQSLIDVVDACAFYVIYSESHFSFIWTSKPNRYPLWLDFFYFEDELFLKALLGLYSKYDNNDVKRNLTK